MNRIDRIFFLTSRKHPVHPVHPANVLDGRIVPWELAAPLELGRLRSSSSSASLCASAPLREMTALVPQFLKGLFAEVAAWVSAHPAGAWSPRCGASAQTPGRDILGPVTPHLRHNPLRPRTGANPVMSAKRSFETLHDLYQREVNQREVSQKLDCIICCWQPGSLAICPSPGGAPEALEAPPAQTEIRLLRLPGLKLGLPCTIVSNRLY